MKLRTRRVPLDFAHTRVRRVGFWGGWFGLVITSLVFLTVIALLVGWVIVFATNDSGPNAWLLTLGPVAFSGVLAVLAALYFQLRSVQRLRQVENAFLTGASHNLRTPLTAIRTAAQTLEDPGLEPEDRAMLLDAVLHETNRLELRIDTLLETARIDFEQRPYRTTEIDIVVLLRDIVRDSRWSFAIRHGHFGLAVSQGEGRESTAIDMDSPATHRPLVVGGDARALRIMFENLIDNAIKSAHNGLHVVIVVTKKRERVEVEITDRGVGFGPEDVQLLFSGRRPGDTRRRGTGLGLPLSRAIARGHRGDLQLVSKGAGLGATALVSLPLSTTPAPRGPPIETQRD